MHIKEKIIMHIDDDMEDCELFNEALQEVSDAKYVGIYDAAEALILLKRGSIYPDLIFLDLNMPRMNGREFLIEMKADDTLKNIPVIIFSTSNVHEMIRLTIGLGVSDYITKPNDYSAYKEMLLAKI